MRKRFTQKERAAVWEKYGYFCAYCGCPLNMQTLRIDHRHPVKLGGSNDFENLMPACHACNYYKDSKTLEIFREEVKKIYARLAGTFCGKMARKYHMLHPVEPIVFWFERFEEAKRKEQK